MKISDEKVSGKFPKLKIKKFDVYSFGFGISLKLKLIKFK